VQAAPILLRRIWLELLQGEHIDVLQPVRVSRSRVIRRQPGGSVEISTSEVERAVSFATRKLANSRDNSIPSLILVLFDSDSDCPATLAPQLLSTLPQANIACVLATVEYETWFVAAAESLGSYLTAPEDHVPDPEAQRCGKGWIKKRFRGHKYSETVDQPSMTAKMDLKLCQQRSPSFDKLCRELRKLLPPT